MLLNKNIYFKYTFFYNFNKSYYDLYGELLPKKLLNKIFDYYINICNSIIESVLYYKIIKKNNIIIDIIFYNDNDNIDIKTYDFILYKHY